MHPKEAANVSKFCSFVQRWSGGPNGETLTNLELYEKSLHHKRSITADDLQLLADCDTEFERIIPAIIYIYVYISCMGSPPIRKGKAKTPLWVWSIFGTILDNSLQGYLATMKFGHIFGTLCPNLPLPELHCLTSFAIMETKTW